MIYSEEVKGYFNYLKKYLYLIFIIYIIIEYLVFQKIGKTNIFMFSSSLFVVLFLICSLLLMFKDVKTNILIYTASIPVIPIILYLLFRLNITWLGEILYLLYFVIFLFNLRKGDFDFKQLIKKNKFLKVSILYIYILCSAIISSLLSYYKLEALNLTFLVIGTSIVYSISLITIKDFNIEFYKKIILFLCIGTTVSGIPDAVVSVYSLIYLKNNIHLYGVLGSNFMLGYTLIILPYIIVYAVNKKVSNNYNKIYKLLLILQILIISTQRSRGILVALMLSFILIILNDRKNILKYSILALIVLAFIGYNVSQRWEFSDIKEQIVTKSIHKSTSENNGIFYYLKEQSKNRRPIWSVSFGMLNDYTYFGVGPGHFKYYLPVYGPAIQARYIDAHNIILDIATEFGVVFTLVFFSAWLFLMIKCLINRIKIRNHVMHEIVFPGFIGLTSLMVYGNITGQGFFTSTYPISFVPTFVFITVITIIMIVNKYDLEDIG